jgi:transposase
MAGRFEGLSDLEWNLFVDIFPPAPIKRGRGMPHPPFRTVVKPVWYALMTGCRWCDLPRGAPWASKSAAHRWLQRWQADGTLAAMQARILGLAEAHGLMQWQYGAIDGSLSPWPTARRLPLAMSGPGFSRGWMPSASEPASVDALGSVPRLSSPIQGMMRKPSAGKSARVASEHRSRNGSGSPRDRVADPSRPTCRVSKPRGPLPGSKRSTAVWSSVGSVARPASRRSWPSPCSISG